jgi:hypothetical protein
MERERSVSQLGRLFEAPDWLVVGGLVSLLAFGGLGARGLWEPDEGRYAHVALAMVRSGDYVVPSLNRVAYFAKPPLTYWMVAAGLRLFGTNEWGARTGHGLAFAATALLVALFGERLVASPRGRWAGVVYATMLLPFAAGSLITPDTPLTLALTAALFCFWSGWTAPAPARSASWMLGFWAGLGLGFLAKGPPALLPIALALAFACLGPPPASGRSRWLWLHPLGVAVFLGVSLPWFLVVAQNHPGLISHLLQSEVVGRIATGVHRRNTRWYMAFVIYPATVLLGALPWSLRWMPAARQLWAGRTRPESLFLGAWIAIPLVILSLASSRLPLYVLPIFPALALASGRAGLHRGARPWLAVWVVSFLGLRLLAAWIPVPQDARALARWIAPHLEPGRSVVVVVDDRIYGLPFYLDVPVDMISRARLGRIPEYRATTRSWDEGLADLGHVPDRYLFLVRRSMLPTLKKRVVREAVACRDVAGPGRYVLLVCDRRDDASRHALPRLSRSPSASVSNARSRAARRVRLRAARQRPEQVRCRPARGPPPHTGHGHPTARALLSGVGVG